MVTVEGSLHKAVACGGRKQFVLSFVFFQFFLVIFSLLEKDKGSFCLRLFSFHEDLSCPFHALLLA
jgi:hypothetical protein